MMKRFSSAALTFCALAAAALPSLASAQSSASDYTSAVRYDAAGRAVGTIAPDPDGSGPLKFAATRTTVDARGLVTKVETGELANWQSENVLPQNWAGFTVLSSVETTYDANRRKVTETAKASNGTAISLTQYSYDSRGRLQCSAVRMNPAAYGSLPASACSLGTEGTEGPDRITKTIYDYDGRVFQIRRGVGTANEVAEVTYSYTMNGQIEHVIDANGNRAEQRYDGYDRQVRWVFPSKTGPTGFDKSNPDTALNTAGALNEGDYEEYTYDNNGNRTSLRKRDGRKIAFTYDALNRVTKKDLCSTGSASCSSLPSTYRRDVFYTYDNRDLQTSIWFDNSTSGQGSITAWDGFGRQKSATDTMDGVSRTLTYRYDKNGNRIRITHPDNAYWQLEYDGLNRANRMLENTTQIGLMSYNQRGTVLKREWPYSAYNVVTTPTYDNAGRTASLTHDVRLTANDVTFNYGYIPSGQLDYVTRDNDVYAWDGQPGGAYTRAYATNGLNQYESAGTASFCYDANGNLTADGDSVYLYDVENRLVEKRAQGTGNTNCAALSYAGALDAKLLYDPLGRLYKVEGYNNGTPQSVTRILYDGNAMVAEYNGSGTMLRRYVHGTNTDADDPLIWYEGSAVTISARRFLLANHQGSIIGITNFVGTLIYANSYDEYGIPSATNTGRFQYTGQVWLEELGLYYYKARVYSPYIGRFLQTDPIGYEDQFNLYSYVGNDPINATDPTGLDCEGWASCPPSMYPRNPEYSINCGVYRTCSMETQARIRSRVNTMSLDDPRVHEQGVAMVNLGALVLSAPLGGRGIGLGTVLTQSARYGLLANRLIRVAEYAKPVASGLLAAGRRRAAATSLLRGLAQGTARIRVIAGAGTSTAFRNAGYYVQRYGGNISDWAKISVSRVTRSGDRVSVHAVQNVKTGKIYDQKVIFQR